MSPLREQTGKRLSAFSRERRPAKNGGGNHVEYASMMDAIDGDLDLVCYWCRKTLALIETTTRTDQSVTYRRGMAKLLNVPFFHIREIRLQDGSWRYKNVASYSEDTPTVTIDEWITLYEVPLRRRHGCGVWKASVEPAWGCATFQDCDGDPEWHCAICREHKDHWWSDCRKGCASA